MPILLHSSMCRCFIDVVYSSINDKAFCSTFTIENRCFGRLPERTVTCLYFKLFLINSTACINFKLVLLFRFHGFGHKCSKCFKADKDRLQLLRPHNTSICEQFNSFINRVKISSANMSFPHFMFTVMAYFSSFV